MFAALNYVGVGLAVAGLVGLCVIVVLIRWRIPSGAAERGRGPMAFMSIVLCMAAFSAGATLAIVGIFDDPQAQREARLRQCAREASVKIDVLAEAMTEPDREMVAVPWSPELWSYEQMDAIGCEAP